jgi:hypothetical protein
MLDDSGQNSVRQAPTRNAIVLALRWLLDEATRAGDGQISWWILTVLNHVASTHPSSPQQALDSLLRLIDDRIGKLSRLTGLPRLPYVADICPADLTHDQPYILVRHHAGEDYLAFHLTYGENAMWELSASPLEGVPHSMPRRPICREEDPFAVLEILFHHLRLRSRCDRPLGTRWSVGSSSRLRYRH